tara:strand:- start:233 stop:445 length:213 start_codon:yes stop_codon:yes gene_type:complete
MNEKTKEALERAKSIVRQSFKQANKDNGTLADALLESQAENYKMRESLGYRILKELDLAIEESEEITDEQ